MRENKYDKLLLASVALLVVSAIMLLISGYNIYFKKRDTINKLGKVIYSTAPKLRDSLTKIYSNTISNIDDNLNLSVSAVSDPDTKIKMEELAKLREEISALLANKNNEEDLQLAKIKIEDLQQKVALLQNKYTGVETENKRLQLLINQLLNSKTATAQIIPKAAITKQKASTLPNGNNGTATAEALHLFAVTGNNNIQETTNAENAEKIVGTFTIKNFPVKGNGEVMVVVLQPDGKVVKNSVWESGTFESTEGKKIYSRKIYTDASDEQKQLNFSLTPERFLKGDYTMQIWYNGNMIAKMVKTFS